MAVLGLAAGIVSWRLIVTVRERDQLAETLASLQAARGRFYTTLSHELRSPLTVSLGAIESALDGRLGELNDHARAIFDRAHRNNLRMIRRVDQLLDLARLESRSLVHQPVHADLAEFLQKLFGLFQSVGEVQGLTMETDGLDAPVPFWFEPELVEKMVMNLLSNAVAFTAAGGHVRLSLDPDEPRDGTVRIGVHDSGEGMDASQLNRLFEPESGSGIGLVLVKKLALAHGGTVDVRSAPGMGSTFTLTLSPMS